MLLIYSGDDDTLNPIIRKGKRKVKKKRWILFIHLNWIANVRAILGISNANDHTEVKADRHPQYEVYENWCVFIFNNSFISK